MKCTSSCGDVKEGVQKKLYSGEIGPEGGVERAGRRKGLLRKQQLPSDQCEVERLFLARAMNAEEHPGPGPAAQAVLDHIPEVAPPGRLAVDMGDDIAGPHPCQMRRASGHQLLHHDLPVGQRDAVDADPPELPGGVGSPS